MKFSTTSSQHQFVPKLPIISKQCNDYPEETTVLIMRRAVGNVVQSIPFVAANRDNHVQLHLSGSSAQSLPSLIVKSSRLSCLLGESFQTRNTKITRKNIRANSTGDCRPSRKVRILHQPSGSNCLVCSASHHVTLRCCRFSGGLANSSRAATCAVVVVVSSFTPASA